MVRGVEVVAEMTAYDGCNANGIGGWGQWDWDSGWVLMARKGIHLLWIRFGKLTFIEGQVV